mmetsp:Transcript_14985/g.41169  ORF Transcript_14985/g.41169 Transcript_14985/m.41169 type:complete len:316 (+) Transcript_14985:976-1923(+)
MHFPEAWEAIAHETSQRHRKVLHPFESDAPQLAQLHQEGLSVVGVVEVRARVVHPGLKGLEHVFRGAPSEEQDLVVHPTIADAIHERRRHVPRAAERPVLYAERSGPETVVADNEDLVVQRPVLPLRRLRPLPQRFQGEPTPQQVEPRGLVLADEGVVLGQPLLVDVLARQGRQFLGLRWENLHRARRSAKARDPPAQDVRQAPACPTLHPRFATQLCIEGLPKDQVATVHDAEEDVNDDPSLDVGCENVMQEGPQQKPLRQAREQHRQAETLCPARPISPRKAYGRRLWKRLHVLLRAVPREATHRGTLLTPRK